MSKWKGLARWKKIVIGIGVFIVAVIALALFATKGLADTANNQLKALRSGDLTKAYSYTSIDFQKVTSLDAFKTFVNSNPSLKQNKSSSFTTREIINNQGTLKGSLKATDGAVTPVEYKFVKESGQWKIIAINLQSTGGTSGGSLNSGSSIAKVLASEQVDSRGVVSESQMSYASTTPKIYVSAYVAGAQSGGQVSAELVYDKTGEKVGPVTNTNSESGDMISNFSFSKPTNNWPAGSYRINVTSGSATGNTTFTVQ